jgi:hypothetical protein
MFSQVGDLWAHVDLNHGPHPAPVGAMECSMRRFDVPTSTSLCTQLTRVANEMSVVSGEIRSITSKDKPAGHSKDNPERVSAGSRARPAPGTNHPSAHAEGDSPHNTVSAPKPILPAGSRVGDLT